MKLQKIEPRQHFAKQFSEKIRGGIRFTEESARALKEGNTSQAILYLKIATECFPENVKLRAMLSMLEDHIEKNDL